MLILLIDNVKDFFVVNGNDLIELFICLYKYVIYGL